MSQTQAVAEPTTTPDAAPVDPIIARRAAEYAARMASYRGLPYLEELDIDWDARIAERAERFRVAMEASA